MESTSLLDIWRAVARGWVLILVAIVLCTALAVGVKLAWPDEYESTAVLTVEPLTISPLSAAGSATVNMETERVVAASTAVLGRASETLGGVPVSDLRSALSVQVPKDSRVLEFTYTAADPQAAADGANAVARAYGVQRTETAQQVVDDTSAALAVKIAQLEEDLAAAAPGSGSFRAIELQIASLQERQAALSAATFYPGTLVGPAAVPTSSSAPGLRVFLVAGVALGALLGFFVALLRERFRTQRDSLARSSPDSGAPVLATRNGGAVAEPTESADRRSSSPLGAHRGNSPDPAQSL